ncbi:MAG: coproporphyrinogen dehydrogenase HemZ [Clostridia bacterium]|nr:coproporphyrinogen dehydrogenase HemZ [Clostridia bacterium]
MSGEEKKVLSVSLMTPTAQFSNDLADVLRIFWGVIDLRVNQPGGRVTVTHREEMSGDERTCEMELTGEATGFSRRSARISPDPLLEKRYHKRLIKQTLYDVMKRIAGAAPPWGSLTGIRPTRLIYEAMGRGLTLEEAAAETRALFDVRPDKAELLRQIVTVQTRIAEPRMNEVDLYVGIPFCVSRCAYCSFLSGEVGKGKQLPPYVDALEKEIAGILRLIDEKGLIPRAFYMGGGTPTSLDAGLLNRVLAAARPFIDRAREVTVEAGRPDTIDESKLLVIRDHGATRISINPQTMHNETLARIGRRHTTAQTEAAYALARRIGFHHINMDLIAGLPGEDEAMFRQTLLWSRDLAPESLTVHTLSIKRSSLLHLWEAQLPDGGMVERMVEAGRAEAAARGMRPYYMYRQKHMAGNLENVGYALPGHECVYNIDMMEETGHVLAAGAGAISKRVDPSIGRIERAPNVSEVSQYIDRAQEMLARKQALWAGNWREGPRPRPGADGA